jgi:DNA-binding transcriptional ArsR family regulator
MRILGTLYAASKAPLEIVAALGDVPTGSVYRHLKVLEESEIIEVQSLGGEPGATYKVYGISKRTSFLTEAERESVDSASFVDLVRMLTSMVQEQAEVYAGRTPHPAQSTKVGAFSKFALLTEAEIAELRTHMQEIAFSTDRAPSPELKRQFVGFFMFPTED